MILSANALQRFFVDGQWTEPRSSRVLDVENPATEEILATVPEGNAEDMAAAIRAARVAFDEGPWGRSTPADRAAAMQRLVGIMERRSPELIELDIAEVGRARFLAEGMFVKEAIAHFADMVDRVVPAFAWQEPILPVVDQSGLYGIGQGVLRHEPMGVAALITPYNAPWFLNVLKLAPALAAGCTVVLKPSPFTPLAALALGEIVAEADLPPGVVNVLTGDAEASELLTTHGDVDIVSFTGSDRTGKLVARQAAETLKRVVLELGGKSANIICEDADLARVVPDVIGNTIYNCGQGCSMLTRTLVHQSLHDELVEAVAAEMKNIVVGDPQRSDVQLGPLIRAAQRERVEQFIDRAVADGAVVEFGGGRPEGVTSGYFVEPTLFSGVRNTMEIAQREVFGPVNVVIPFTSDDEAVALANNSDFGLSGGVWSHDPARAFAIATRMRTGSVTVNGGGGNPVSPYAAFGGYKHSGLGREWGVHGLSEFLETKSVTWGVAHG